MRPLPVVHSQNYCVLAKLRDFVASPQCWKVAQVDALKDKVRKLYTIMNSFCRRVSDTTENPTENSFPTYQPRLSELLEEEGRRKNYAYGVLQFTKPFLTIVTLSK